VCAKLRLVIQHLPRDILSPCDDRHTSKEIGSKSRASEQQTACIFPGWKDIRLPQFCPTVGISPQSILITDIHASILAVIKISLTGTQQRTITKSNIKGGDGCPYPGCGKLYTSASNRRSHVRDKHEVKVFRCAVCNKEFGAKQVLDKHVRSVHDRQKYPCPHPGCNNLYTSESNRDFHYRYVQAVQSPGTLLKNLLHLRWNGIAQRSRFNPKSHKSSDRLRSSLRLTMVGQRRDKF